ncbi:MAG TPA: DUF1887 family protein, partial [Anaerolineales bacterium]|nr:DUF1887 family protein [Anaerolineales bacterium]
MNTYNSHPRAMVLLVGEQPAPNLLPVRQTKPDVAALVHTDYTKHTAENLRRLLEPMCRCLLCEVDAYEIPLIRETMDRFLEEEIKEHSLLFNLTGGTKPMVLAAFDLAHRHGAPFVYMETKEGETILYTYSISEEGTIRLDR